MQPVADEDLDWVRGTPADRTILFAIPAEYEVYGILDLTRDEGETERRLMPALGTAPGQQLIAGWIERNAFMTEPGETHLLYANWRYRVRTVTVAELTGRPSQQAGDFPDLLFPRDHTWLLSTLWDDTWRSIGVSEATATEIEKQLPAFERIGTETDISDTGREVR